jgi:hypothetical protein
MAQQIRRPTADDAVTWIPREGSDNYAMVNETSPDDETYNSSEQLTQIRRPTGDDVVSWTPSSGVDNYAMVDEEVASDDDYNSITAASIPDSDIFTFTAFDIPAGAINIVPKTVIRAKKATGAAVMLIIGILTIDGVDYTSDQVNAVGELTDEYVTYSLSWAEGNPATSFEPWTAEDVNGIQKIGYLAVPYDVDKLDTYVSQFYVSIDYVVGSLDLFTFDVFSIDGGPITLVSKIRARKSDALNTKQLIAVLTVSGVDYNYEIASDLTTEFANYTRTWETNPATSLPWQEDDINGIGANPLEKIGYRII